MVDARFLWGRTKANQIRVTEFVDLDAQSSAPTASIGRMYLDSFGMVNVCVDGTSWATVYKMNPRANIPQPYKGRVYMDMQYKIRVCEDGSTFTTITTT